MQSGHFRHEKIVLQKLPIQNVKRAAMVPLYIPLNSGSPGLILPFNNGGIFETFDYVVCTLPMPLLRGIVIQPLFSGRKMVAIRDVIYYDAQINKKPQLLGCGMAFFQYKCNVHFK